MTNAPPAGRDPTDPGAQLQHYLPEAVSEKIFRRDIVPFLLAHGEPQDHPLVVVLSAQPGAGKTAVARAIRAEFATSGDAVAIEVDGLKAFHPQLRALRHDLGEVTADELVHADARRWLDKSLDYLALERRVNIVVEHGLRSPEVTDHLLGRFARAGYRIEAALLTTPAAVSMQGILLRYQAGHEKGGGRDIAPELHEQRYRGLLEIADRLYGDPRVAAIRLFRRDGTLVHHTERDTTTRWSSPATTPAALETERARPWTIEESQSFSQAHHSLVQRMDPAWLPRIEASRSAAQPLLHPAVNSPSPQDQRPRLSFPKKLDPSHDQPGTPPATRKPPGRDRSRD